MKHSRRPKAQVIEEKDNQSDDSDKEPITVLDNDHDEDISVVKMTRGRKSVQKTAAKPSSVDVKLKTPEQSDDVVTALGDCKHPIFSGPH